MTVSSLLRRLLETGVALWALVSLVFLLSHRDPIKVEEMLLPDRGELSISSGAQAGSQAAAEAAVRQRLGLDLPLFYLSRQLGTAGAPAWQWHGRQNQYHRWLSELLQGNLGRSLRTGQPVASQLGSALRFTLPLTALSLLLVMATALWLGQRLAGPRRWWQAPVRATLMGVHSVPLFVVALLLLLVFANPELLPWFPAHGLGEEATADGWAGLGAWSYHLVLPVASLVVAVLPGLTLQLEAALRQELRMDYATTARAKGLPEMYVIRRHALRNALLPTITQFTDLVPALVSGAVVVEVVYALPGMGRLLAEAAVRRDYPILVGGLLLSGGARLGALLLADGLYGWADPRIRWQR